MLELKFKLMFSEFVVFMFFVFLFLDIRYFFSLWIICDMLGFFKEEGNIYVIVSLRVFYVELELYIFWSLGFIILLMFFLVSINFIYLDMWGFWCVWLIIGLFVMIFNSIILKL